MVLKQSVEPDLQKLMINQILIDPEENDRTSHNLYFFKYTKIRIRSDNA